MQFWVILTVFVATTLGRYLPPAAITNVSQFRHGTDIQFSTAAGTSSIRHALGSPDRASVLLTDDIGERISVHGLDESANDDLWKRHINKGNSLMCAMCGTDAAAGWQAIDTRTPPSAASKWANFNDMVDWYWWEAKYDGDICDMGTYWGMQTTFHALGINPRSNKAGGNIQCFQIRHQNENAKFPVGTPRPPLEQSYTSEGKLYHATNAEHFFAMDIRAGVIVGVVLLSPEYTAQRLWGWMPTNDQLPKLRQLSDIYWLYWQSLNNAAGTRVDNIKTYIVYSIHNEATKQIIARALRSRGRESYESWPGQYFTSDSPEGVALLGSPIGATIGFFLMQHKRELGNKYVSGIRIVLNDGVEGDTHKEVDLVYHIADVPPDRQITDDPMDVDQPQGRADINALALTAAAHLVLRDSAASPVEMYLLGSNNVLRVHRIIAH